jgi:hypothetical protein
MKPKKISVNPPYPRHPRSINPYTDYYDFVRERVENSFVLSPDCVKLTPLFIRIGVRAMQRY